MPPTTKQPAKPASKTPAAPAANIDKQWDDANARAESGDINRIKLEKGENVVRVIDMKFTENFVVFIQDTDGNDRRISMGLDPRENKEEYAHLFETIPDASPGHRYYFRAIQGKRVKEGGAVKTVMENQIKLFEIGPSIFKQMYAIHLAIKAGDYDPAKSLTDINLNITRTGEKLKTEYNVLPSPKPSPLPKDLIGDVDLEAMVVKTPISVVYDILGEEYAGDDAATEETPVEDDAVEIPVEEETVVEAEPEPEEETPAADNDGLDDMNREELKSYIKETLSAGLEKPVIVVYKPMSDDDIRTKIREYWTEHPELFGGEEVEAQTEPEVEETVTDETVVEEDDLSGLDEIEDTPPPKPAAKPATKPGTAAKPGAKK